MKILHVTDNHGDIEPLKAVVDFGKEERVDLIAHTGDLIGPAFPFNSAKRMQNAYRFIRSLSDNGTFEDILEAIKNGEGIRDDWKAARNDYLTLEGHFDKVSEKQYIDAKEILDSSGIEYAVVSGNWDTQRFFDIFDKEHIHGRSREIQGRKFSGYGNSREKSIFVPPRRYLEFDNEELYQFLMKEDPEVALTHVPPYGINDVTLSENGIVHIGDFAVLAYLESQRPSLVLCGHAHDGTGYKRDDFAEDTYIVNSGNLGRFHASKSHGTFSIVQLDNNNYVRQINFYHKAENKINLIGEIRVKEQNGQKIQ